MNKNNLERKKYKKNKKLVNLKYKGEWRYIVYNKIVAPRGGGGGGGGGG